MSDFDEFLPYKLPRSDQVDPDLHSRFTELANEYKQITGEPLRVTDSFRTNAEQTDLYARKPNLAAKPGSSKHEVGKALDIDQGQIAAFGEDNWSGLLEKHGFVRPALSKGETWHIELPRFEEAGKVAATVSNDFAEFLPKEQNDFAEFLPKQEQSKSIFTPEGLTDEEYAKQLRESTLNSPDLTEAARKIIDFPHNYLTVPFVEKYLQPKLEQYLGTEPVSGISPSELDVMKSAGVDIRGIVPNAPSASAAQVGTEAAKMLVDLPVYSGTLKVLGGVGKMLSSLLPEERLFATVPKTVPKAPAGEVLKPGKALLEEILGKEAQLKEGIVGAYEAQSFPPTSLERKLTPASTEQIVKAQQRANERIIEAAPTLWNREQIKWLRSGGPTSEEMQSFFRNHLASGGTIASAVEAISGKFKVSPEQAAQTIRNIGQINLGKVGTVTGEQVQATSTAVDTTNIPLASVVSASDFKSNLPSLRDIGTKLPEVPSMPYQILAEDTTPKGNLINIKSEFISPSVISRRLFSGDGPILDWFKSWHQTLFEQPYWRKFLNNNFQSAGLMDDVVASEKAAQEKFGPIARKLEGVLGEYTGAQTDLAHYKGLLKKQAAGSPQATETAAKIKQLEQVGYPKEAVELEKQLEVATQELEKQFANIRIKRAADGNADSWNLLSGPEREVATNLQKFYKKFGERFQAQGVPTISGTYTHHVYHWAGYDTDTGLKTFADKLWWKPNTTPTLLTFLSRKGAADWFPLAYQSTDAYIGAATRKLAFNPWYAKWTPAMDRWDATGYNGTSKWLRGFLERNMTTGESDIIDKTVNGLVNFEYGHYLLGNFSPAILHAFKVLQTPGYWGFKATGKALEQYSEAMTSRFLGKGGSENLRAIEFYNLTPQIIQAMEQSPAWAGTFQPNFWQKLRGNPILNPTRLTEHFDRGVQTLAAISRGEAVGATANTMNNAVMDSLVKMNFYGWDAPAFMQKHRALTMFQQQPWKLAEMKGQLIRDALLGERDIYGQSHWPKVVRLATMLGGLYEAGSLAGYDLLKHVGHIPFMTDTMGGGHGPAIAPVIGDLQTVEKVFDEGWQEGLKGYLSYGGAPQKMLQERIPERYNESRAQWLMGIPSTGWREKARDKSEAIQNRLRRRILRSSALYGEDITPYQFLQGLSEEK